MGVLTAIADFLLSVLLGLASGFFMFEVDPSLVGGEAVVPVLALLIGALTSGIAARGVVKGCISGAVTGYFLKPARALVPVLLAAFKVGFRPLAWSVLADLMTAFAGLGLVPFAIGGAIIGGLAGYLTSKTVCFLRARREAQAEFYEGYQEGYEAYYQ